MSECLFCRIISGEIPGSIVYQDDHVVAFKDVNPQAPVHVLVVPRRHVPTLLEPEAASGELLSHVYSAIQKVAADLNLDKGFRVVANYGPDGGQTVYHIHFHLLGRRVMGWPPG
jgi:histidine triad (HIT) family protein